MTKGVCLQGGTLARASRHTSAASAADCYRACEAAVGCVKFTFKTAPTRCFLKGAVAKPKPQEASSVRVCTSGAVRTHSG